MSSNTAYIVKIGSLYFNGFGKHGRLSTMRLFANAQLFSFSTDASEVVEELKSKGFSAQVCECGVLS
jgi:hypothetical protein